MIDKFRFSISTGFVHPSVRNVEWLQQLGCPLDFSAYSKIYDTSDECIKECIQFVNKQIPKLQNGIRTIFEPNPFLAGQDSDMDEDTLAYHKGRWARDEMFKIHAANPIVKESRLPITCSIFKVLIPTGFTIEGNDTQH